MGKIKIDGFLCERCSHIWASRAKNDNPIVCPKCHSPYWNIKRKLKKENKKEDKK